MLKFVLTSKESSQFGAQFHSLGSILLSADQEIGIVQRFALAILDFADDTRLEVDKHCSWHDFPALGVGEEREHILIDLNILVELSIGFDAMLKREELPAR